MNKLTLMNYVDAGDGARARVDRRAGARAAAPVPDVVARRVVDKALRLIQCTRKQAQVAIGLDGGYYGHTFASCRSLSDPSVHAGGPGHFAWPRVPHPARAGTGTTIAALRAAVAAAGGADKVLGFVYELVQERTGACCRADFVAALAALRKELGIPLIAIETTTHVPLGPGAFLSTRDRPLPDVLAWWGGGQTGYLHTSRAVVRPRAAHAGVDLGRRRALAGPPAPPAARGARDRHRRRSRRALDARSRASPRGPRRVSRDRCGRAGGLADALAERGSRVRQFPNGKRGIIPALDQIEAAARALRGGAR